MASEAQILANRRNAEKSTGPHTEEGKAISSQNAVKHGLSARQDVIGSEDHEEFDLHRKQMLEELTPVGPVERMLAERVVSLSWRLKRAERIQNEAFDYLAAKDASDSTANDAGLTLGRVVVEDFSTAKTIERLVMYERRIESSLFRTMTELRRMKNERIVEARRQAAARPYVPQPPSAGITAEGGGATYGVTMNGRPPAEPAERSLCKTNPILAGQDNDEFGADGVQPPARARLETMFPPGSLMGMMMARKEKT
jgi:hypothetical protein